MTDFKNFLEIGLQAAHDAERRRKEILAILSDLNNQVKEATKGVIGIEIRPDDLFGISSLMKNSPSAAALLMEKALFAFRFSDNKQEKLASWSEGNAGYPCKITLNQTVYSCEDRTALENCLGIMLQEPAVGEKIFKLMKDA